MNKITLLEVLDDDIELIMAWRSLPEVFNGCYTQRSYLTWDEHYTWWITRGRWWKFWFIVLDDGKTKPRRVGIVNFGQLDNWNPEVAYQVGELGLWGQGIATRAVPLALEWLKEHGYCKVHTTVSDTNVRSQGVMKNLGFVNAGKAREGESTWELYLSKESLSSEYTSGRKEL